MSSPEQLPTSDLNNPGSKTQNSKKTPLEPETAISSRLLAAFIDLLVIQAILIPINSIYSAGDYYFLLSALCALFYFGIGNSHITSGSSLGKKAFGLTTLNSKTAEYLSIPQSLYRSLFQLILPILLMEIPPLWYREHSTIGNPMLLELPMLLVLLYTLWNITRILIPPYRRAGHDIISKSIVVRNYSLGQRYSLNKASKKTHATLHVILSILIACLLWSLSVINTPAVSKIHHIRYALEKELNLKIISLQSDANTVYMRLLHPSQNYSENHQELCERFCKKLKEKQSLHAEIKRIRFELFFEDGKSSKQIFISSDNCEISRE